MGGWEGVINVVHSNNKAGQTGPEPPTGPLTTESPTPPLLKLLRCTATENFGPKNENLILYGMKTNKCFHKRGANQKDITFVFVS